NGDPNRVLRQLKGLRDQRAGRERDLRRGPDLDAIAVPFRDERARLDGDGLRAVSHVAALHDDSRAGHRRVRVALDDAGTGGLVAAALDALVDGVALPVLVDELRALLE